MDTETLGKLAGGTGAILWFLAYILIIRRSRLDKTYGVPFVALCANISWEFTFSFLVPQSNQLQHIANIIWFVMDVIIVWQYIQYGRIEFNKLPQKYFYPTLVLGIGVAFAVIRTSVIEFDDTGGHYSAFAISLMMGVLFSTMLLERDSVRGQSIYIAILKMVGTVGYSILFYTRYPDSVFLFVLYVTAFAFDLIYLLLLYEKCQQSQIAPFKRF